jgi:hypothetical protein
LGWEPRVTFSQLTGEGRWRKKKKKKSKKTYLPYFLGYVTLITHIFLFGLSSISLGRADIPQVVANNKRIDWNGYHHIYWYRKLKIKSFWNIAEMCYACGGSWICYFSILKILTIQSNLSIATMQDHGRAWSLWTGGRYISRSDVIITIVLWVMLFCVSDKCNWHDATNKWLELNNKQTLLSRCH